MEIPTYPSLSQMGEHILHGFFYIIFVTNINNKKYYYKMYSHEPHNPKTERTTK